jgi:hypothetical protein
LEAQIFVGADQIVGDFGKVVGVESDISVENTQLADSGNAGFTENATIPKSSVQITYKDFPELQNFQAHPALAQHAEVLFYICSSTVCRLNDSVVELLPGIWFEMD